MGKLVTLAANVSGDPTAPAVALGNGAENRLEPGELLAQRLQQETLALTAATGDDAERGPGFSSAANLTSADHSRSRSNMSGGFRIHTSR